MNKFLIGRNKGFTLAELMVSITIMVILSGGIFFYFDTLSNGLKNITFKSKTFQDVNFFEELFQNSLKDYNNILLLKGNIFPEAQKGFSLLVLTNEEKNKGILWGSYDMGNEKIIFGDISHYKIYHPAFVILNESDIHNIENNFDLFVTEISPGNVQYFKNIFITKWGIYKILSPDMVQIDFMMSFEKYSELIGSSFEDIYEHPYYKSIKISMIY